MEENCTMKSLHSETDVCHVLTSKSFPWSFTATYYHCQQYVLCSVIT